MEVINTILAYESSPKIIQRDDAFSFSIDSTILSFFAKIRKRTGKIVDLGTGNGAIPLFLSMFTDKPIQGIELQEDLVDMARRSISLNHLEPQIEIIEGDIKGIHNTIGRETYGMVIANPPYFKEENNPTLSSFDKVKLARHELTITMEDIIEEAEILLKDGGSLTMIQRTDRFLETIMLLKKYHFAPKRIRFVYPTSGKESYVFMIDAAKRANEHGLKVLEPLYIFKEGAQYSDEILSYFHYGEKNEKNK